MLHVAQSHHDVRRLLSCHTPEGNLLIAPAVLWVQDMPTVTPPCDIDHLFQAN